MDGDGFDRFHDRYTPRFRVTDLVAHRYGGTSERREKLARYAAPIEPDSPVSNRDVLFGEVPLHVAVAGVAHDATLQLYLKDLEFAALDVDPGEEEVRDFLDDLVTGKDHRSTYLRDRLVTVHREYGVPVEDLPRRTVAGRQLGEFLDDLSHRYVTDGTNRSQVLDRTVDVDVDSRRVTGRADMVVETTQGREVWEEKVTGRSDVPADRHVYQANIYAWHLDAEPVVDYPVQGEQHRPDDDPAEVSDAMLDDILGFAEDVHRVRQRQTAEIQERTGIDHRDGETLEEYRERVHRVLSPAASTAVVEEATKEALTAV
ncbi:MAG: hypothetical protein ABEI97_04235 [Candidatus Nanohaloarchaea archaeon]